MDRLPTWFSRQPLWIQEGINRLLKNGSWFGSDLDVLLVLCKKQAGIDISPDDPKDPSPLHKSDFVTQTSSTANLRLNQIANIEGINALAPKRPLEFGKTNLCLIYGGSGSGKSGYVRILKHACGAREIGRLLGNTFDSTNAKQKATIKYDINDNKFEKEFTTETGRIEELLPVEIFDTACSRVYVSKENEVAIEPDLLGFFSDLVFACGKLETKLDTEISKKLSSKPSIPHELDGTISERWFANISCDTTDVDIDEKTQWTDNEQIELQECTSHLAVNEPIKEALKYRNVVIQIENLLGDIKNINDAINETGTIEFRELFTVVATKKNVVKVAAENAFASAPLDGIGSDVWLELWKAARLFSEQKAYPNETFPNVNSDALCVLCQQSLNDDAKKRFKTFEEFVNDTLQKQAQIAENTLIKKITELKELPSEKDIEKALSACSIQDENEKKTIIDWYSVAIFRRDKMIEGVADNELPTISSIENLQFLYDRKRELESSATSIEKQADIKEREKLVARERELKAKKWMSEQRDAILKDVNRQKEIKLLEKAKRLTSTTALSNKKSSLANFLVTDAFISRFKSELSKLSAHQIPVKLEKTRTEKGKVWHQVNLENSVINHKAGDILSEGEFRIVSLAAFIADILGHNGSTPVVFDDPISSLDQDFEEATTKRLVQLAKSNQTIVFTHRLSMLALFELYAKKENVDLEVVAIGREGSRIGVPRDAPSEIKKPKKVLNRYAGERLARLQKKLKNEGWDAYEVEAKSFCSDIRILIERMVENDLLADVVQRFRRDIMTKGKIMKLSKITLEDCKFIDDMMTKFSQYEHSQSNETPVPIPDPDTLGEELVKLKEWLSRFENRQIPSATESYLQK